jgi:ubiquitin carboxyl-terminal hydrolase L3
MTETKRCVNWLPLESNPSMLNMFAHRIGMPTDWLFVDVFGLDSELLQLVPSPCIAVTLLYPCNSNMYDHVRNRERRIQSEGQHISPNLFYMKQLDDCGNACGTIATVHSIANNLSHMTLLDGALKEFLNVSAGLSPDAIGRKLLEQTGMFEASDDSASTAGQTQTPDREDNTNYHFITFVNVDGHIYDVDGRKAFPINCGPTTADNFLSDTAKVIQSEYMAVDPTNFGFSILALTKAQ